MKRLIFFVAIVALSFTACKKESKQEQPTPLVQVPAPAADAAKAEAPADANAAKAEVPNVDAAKLEAVDALAQANADVDLQNLDPKIKSAFEAALNLMNQIGDAAGAATCDDILAKLKEIPEDSFTQFNEGSKVIETIPEEERAKYTSAYGGQLMAAMMKMTTLNEKCKDSQEIEAFLTTKMGLENAQEGATPQEGAAPQQEGAPVPQDTPPVAPSDAAPADNTPPTADAPK